MSERDTKFLGFANLLWDDLHTLYLADTENKEGLTYEEARARYEQMDKTLIAQRAYDLVYQTFMESRFFEPHAFILYDSDMIPHVEEAIAELSDLTEWPKQLTPEDV